MSAADSAVRVDKVVTSGTFSLDGGTWDVENNVWVIGNDDECIVIDAAHDGRPILVAASSSEQMAASSSPTPATRSFGRSIRRVSFIASQALRR